MKILAMMILAAISFTAFSRPQFRERQMTQQEISRMGKTMKAGEVRRGYMKLPSGKMHKVRGLRVVKLLGVGESVPTNAPSTHRNGTRLSQKTKMLMKGGAK